MVAEPNESHYGILRLPVNCGTADMFAKWPILAEKAFLRRVNAAWLSRSERRTYAYSTLRPPTFSGDSLASAVWLTVRNLWRWRDGDRLAQASVLETAEPAGRQQNRRVELVISGEVIGVEIGVPVA